MGAEYGSQSLDRYRRKRKIVLQRLSALEPEVTPWAHGKAHPICALNMATNRGTRRQCFKVGRLDQRLKQILRVSILNEGYYMLRKIKHTVYSMEQWGRQGCGRSVVVIAVAVVQCE